MKYEVLYQNLLIQLRNRINQNSKLVTKLVDILALEKMAIYRRLRQEVPFTFEEIVVISKEFNISLDGMLGVDARTALPFRFKSPENDNPVEIDYLMLEEYLQTIKDIAVDSDGEISSVANLLPQLFYTGFKHIYNFYYFKWRYYTIPSNQIKTYHEIVLPDRLTKIVEDIFAHSQKVKNNYFILDRDIFNNFVNDVSYFNSIRLIRDEDVFCIKEELFRFLDYMEIIAVNGFVDKPCNKVFIYISDTNIDTSYSSIDSKSSLKFAMIWSFIFNSILTFEEEMLIMIKNRIRSIIRTSTLLSVTGEKQRTEYFATQRRIVAQL